MNEHYDDNWETCDSVGMGGNCGLECPVFLRGDCDQQCNTIEEIVKGSDLKTETFESYEIEVREMIDEYLEEKEDYRLKDSVDAFDRSMEMFN